MAGVERPLCATEVEEEAHPSFAKDVEEGALCPLMGKDERQLFGWG